jgi:hypothetical protein
MCPATETFSADEGHPVGDMAVCLGMVKELGWTSKKIPGYAWELYCPKCSLIPDRRPVAKGD